jgi:hypothetical protein
MTAPETILPDLPDREPVRELRFHLRSLQHDLAASITRLQTCLPLPAAEPAAMWRLRETVADAASAIEHDARHHAQQAVALLFAVSGEGDHDAVEIESEVTPAFACDAGPLPDDARDRLTEELRVTLAALEPARAAVIEIAATRGGNAASLRPRVRSIAETLWRVAWPAALRCLALAQSLHRAADPTAAAAEDRADELATPLRELVLVGARALEICPRCGAQLTAEDRTFDGSYCENCRTRFLEPAPPIA